MIRLLLFDYSLSSACCSKSILCWCNPRESVKPPEIRLKSKAWKAYSIGSVKLEGHRRRKVTCH